MPNNAIHFRLYNDLKTAANCSIQASLSKHDTPSAGANVKFNNDRNRKSDLSQSGSALSLSLCLDRLDKTSTDLLVEKAEKIFYNGEYKECVKLLNA